jgi:hypothetical protein
VTGEKDCGKSLKDFKERTVKFWCSVAQWVNILTNNAMYSSE